jgi:hypothetical protein
VGSISARQQRLVLQLAVVLALSGSACSQQKAVADDQTGDLQKAVQNPVASLISVPLQNNTNFDIGPLDRTQNVLNIQPVIPISVSERWNLITRIIAPLIYQPDVNVSDLGTMGLGDTNPTFFLSPAKPEKLIWGIGPTFILPTATNRVLARASGAEGRQWLRWCSPRPGPSARW